MRHTHKTNTRMQIGITLIELMFALAIGALILSMTSTTLSAAANAARTSRGVASLYDTFLRARIAAVSSSADVVLCPSTDGATCSAGDHWENGWIGFVATDKGSDRRADERIVLRQEALPSRVHLVTSSGRTRLRFQSLGGGNAGSNATFTFCDGRGARRASAYALGNGGNLHPVTPDPAHVASACAGL